MAMLIIVGILFFAVAIYAIVCYGEFRQSAIRIEASKFSSMQDIRNINILRLSREIDRDITR